MKKLISVIAPMYNEKELVHEYFTATRSVLETISIKYDYEVIFVNDGSIDETLKMMEQEKSEYPNSIGIVSFTRNFGLEAAVEAGIRYAKGDLVVVMDADLQDPPELILKMIEKYERGSEIVTACRESRSTDSHFKAITAKLFYGVIGQLSGNLNLEKSAANYRLLTRFAVEKLLALPEVNRVFRVSVPYIGMKTDVVFYTRSIRTAGKSKYNIPKMIRYALDSITSLSIKPLRMTAIFSAFGIIFLGCGIFVLILSSAEMKPFALLMIIMSIFFICSTLSMTLLGEYIGQILIEVKHRPTFFVQEYQPSGNASRRGN